MRPFALASLALLVAGPLAAQSVPGRDLLYSPIGLTGEAAAFGTGPAAGLWNPATGILPEGHRFRLALAALNAPIDVAFTAQVIGGAWHSERWGSFFASIARAGVADLVRTDTDPQSIGGDIPYGIWVNSAGLSRRVHAHASAGAALRWMAGRIDGRHGSRVAGDFGVIIDRLTTRDIKVAASTFLWSPGSDDPPTLTGAGDFRLVNRDSISEVRAGVGVVHTARAATEIFPFVAGRFGRLDLRGGPVRVAAYGAVTWRSRLALAIHQDDFTIGVAREENSAGLTPTYQLSVSTVRR